MRKLIVQLRDSYLVKVKWRKYKIAAGFHAGARVRLWARNNITIGRNFYIGRDSQIEADCTIGDYVMFGNRVAIVGRYDHNYRQIGVPTRMASQIRSREFNWLHLTQMTYIEDDVWVGYGSTILSGIRIGTGSIIAAGSVVTKDVEPYSIYAGSPAKKVKNRFDSENELLEHIALYRKYKENSNQMAAWA